MITSLCRGLIGSFMPETVAQVVELQEVYQPSLPRHRRDRRCAQPNGSVGPQVGRPCRGRHWQRGVGEGPLACATPLAHANSRGAASADRRCSDAPGVQPPRAVRGAGGGLGAPACGSRSDPEPLDDRARDRPGGLAKPRRRPAGYVPKGVPFPTTAPPEPVEVHQIDVVGPRHLDGGVEFHALSLLDVGSHEAASEIFEAPRPNVLARGSSGCGACIACRRSHNLCTERSE
jgi:hypothetical protein